MSEPPMKLTAHAFPLSMRSLAVVGLLALLATGCGEGDQVPDAPGYPTTDGNGYGRDDTVPLPGTRPVDGAEETPEADDEGPEG